MSCFLSPFYKVDLKNFSKKNSNNFFLVYLFLFLFLPKDTMKSITTDIKAYIDC